MFRVSLQHCVWCVVCGVCTVFVFVLCCIVLHGVVSWCGVALWCGIVVWCGVCVLVFVLVLVLELELELVLVLVVVLVLSGMVWCGVVWCVLVDLCWSKCCSVQRIAGLLPGLACSSAAFCFSVMSWLCVCSCLSSPQHPSRSHASAGLPHTALFATRALFYSASPTLLVIQSTDPDE